MLTAVGVIATMAAGPPSAEAVSAEADAGAASSIRITEWMYRGLGDTNREYIEVTNVGPDAVDMTGWSYDDESRSPGGFDLSGFGIVEPGESAVLTEMGAAAFRDAWQLCADVKVLGPFSNNIGRNDEINIFDAGDQLVDRLTYGDQSFPGSIRTDARGGWVSEEGLGQNDVFEWTLSTVGDVEGSYGSTPGDTGSPGFSRHGGHDPCEGGGGDGESPTIAIDQPIVVGAIGDPTNPGAVLTLDDPDHAAADLTVDVSVVDGSVIGPDGVEVAGDTAERHVSFDPVGRGVTTVTFTVTDPDGNADSINVSYAASNEAPDSSGRYHHRVSDASAALDVGDGYALLVNDEINTVFLHRQDGSGPPVKTWTFTNQQLGTSDEIDFEGLARSGDLLVMSGSHGNNRSGEVRAERRTFVAATIAGAGADTELAFRGRYNGLWSELRSWDQSDGHGLGADALGFVAGTAPGVQPNPPSGFNVEALEFSPDGQAVYVGFRAPTIDVDGVEHGLIVPLLNVDDIVDDAPGTGPAQFGDPILLDLDGRSIRALRRNAENEYLISAGPSQSNGTWALYTWDGDPASPPVVNRELPHPNPLTGGSWESIVAVPHPLEPGATVRLVADSGDTNFYGTGQTKDLAAPYQKSYSQEFELAGSAGPGQGEQSISVTVPESVEPGEFVWSIDGDGAVDLGETSDQGSYLGAVGAMDPIVVTDTREGGPVWSVSGQVSDFSDGVSGSYLGWTPEVITEGAGATAGDAVASGIDGGDGLSVASTLASATDGHEVGSGTVGAGLDLRFPVETDEYVKSSV